MTVPDMFERFTSQARRVVALAQQEARTLNHNWIGTEHLMLGLIGEGSGLAAEVLASLGITLEAARGLVEEVLGRGEQAPSGDLPFTPRSKKVLELASGYAAGRDYIGTEHILLGLIQEVDGVGAMVLSALGADQNWVRLRMTQLYRDQGNDVAGEGSRVGNRAGTRLPASPVARIDSLDHRLASIERLSLTEELRRVNAELARLRAILRERGIEPGEDPA